MPGSQVGIMAADLIQISRYHPVGFCRLRELAIAFGKRDCELADYQIPVSRSGYWWLAGVFLIFIGGMGVLLSISGQPETVNDLPLRVKFLLDKAIFVCAGAMEGRWQPAVVGYYSSSERMQKIERLSNHGGISGWCNL